MGCAVTADLNRHLAEVDKAEAKASAVEMLADQWLSHPEKLKQAWHNVIVDMDLDLRALLCERSMRSGRFSGMTEEVADSLFLSELDDMVEQAMSELADAHLEAEADQNAIDAALDAAEDREYWRDRGRD